MKFMNDAGAAGNRILCRIQSLSYSVLGNDTDILIKVSIIVMGV